MRLGTEAAVPAAAVPGVSARTQVLEWFVRRQLGDGLKARLDRPDVALEDCWDARPQLSFSRHLRPKDGRLPHTCCHKLGLDDIKFNLVFFSTFEELQ